MPAPVAPPASPPPRPQPPATPRPIPEASATPAPVTDATPLAGAQAEGEVVTLAMTEIVARLPASLAALATGNPEGTFAVPAASAIEQLRTGAVRVTFGQLRREKAGLFAADNTFDDVLVDLPLAPILAAVGPAALSRRANQTRLDAPDSVTAIFGPKGLRPKPSAPATASVTAPVPVPAAAPAVTPTAPTPFVAPATIKMPDLAPSPAPLPTPPKPTTIIAPPSTAPKPAPAAPLPFAAAHPSPALSAPVPAPSAPTPAATPSGALTVDLASLSAAWPPEIQQELAQINPAGVKVNIPVSALEPGMKTGRVVFTWADMRGWLIPPIAMPTTLGSVQVELPLKIIAPLFMAARRPTSAQRKISVAESIPELFGGAGKPVVPITAPTVAPKVEPTPAPPDPLGEIFGQPSRRDWTTQQIAQQIVSLAGVSASVIATADGLLVAGQVPAPMKAETLAGFMPQMFSRMATYTEGAQLGTLRVLTLQAGQAPCAIFKAGPLYLAVLGHAGHALPEALLERIAGELAKRKP